MPLISVNKLSKAFHNRTLLDEVSFTINKGDKVALIGNNGAGKTTLFRMIEGKLAPDEGSVIHHGTVTCGYLSQNMDDLDISTNPLKSEELARLEIEIANASALLVDTTSPDAANNLRNYEKLMLRYEALGGYTYESDMKAALSGLGLENIDWTRPISGFSGGEKMRICLSRLIVSRPDVLLLDEPTNHLDTDAMEWLEGFIRSYGGAVFLISHDRYFIDKTVTKIFELDGAKITTYRGNYTEYRAQKEQFLKDQRQLVANLEKELVRQQGVTQTMLSHRNISGYHAREKVVAKLSDKLDQEKSKIAGGPMHMSFKVIPEPKTGDPNKRLLAASHIGKVFPDGKELFRDVTFDIRASDKLFLVGPNGCGKTTMLNLLLGKIDDFSGDVLISGSAQCGLMGQFVPFDDETRTILDELVSRSDFTETEARNMLARFGFRDIDVYKEISVLSGGERSRLYLCCLLQEKPDILFLDEPTNHLDIESREVLEDALAEYNGAILAVSHDRYFIEKCQTGIVGFVDGHVASFRNYNDYRADVANSKATKEKKVNPHASAKESKKEQNARVANGNRAVERKEVAKRKERIRTLEKEIAELEIAQKEMEASFGADTTPETYEIYADNGTRLEALYEEYVAISGET